MKNTMKKTVSLVLCLCMLIGLAPVVSFAADEALAGAASLEFAEIYGANELEQGFKLSLDVRAKDENGNALDIESCTVQFKLADGAEAGIVSIIDAANGLIRAEEIGSTAVIAVVSDGTGSVTSAPYEITVIPQNPKSHQVNLSSRVSAGGILFEASHEVDGWAVNRDLSALWYSNASESTLSTYLRWVDWGIECKVPSFGNTREADTAFDFYVDYDGWYTPVFSGLRIKNAAAEANLYLNGEFIGKYNFHGDESLYDYPLPKSLNAVYLRAGEKNTFIVRSMKRGGTAWQPMVDFSLKYVGTESPTFESVEIEASKSAISVGEKAKVSAIATLSNGTEYQFGFKHGYDGNAGYPSGVKSEYAYQSFVSSVPGVVSVDEDGNIEGLSAGTATITATAVIDDVTMTATQEIVVSADSIGNIVTNKDKYTILVGGTDDIVASAFLASGTEITADTAFTYATNNAQVVTVNTAGKLTAKNAGSTTVTVTAKFNGASKSIEVPVRVLAEGFSKVEVSSPIETLKLGGAGYDLIVKAFDNNGNAVDMSGATVSYSSSSDAVSVSADGHITPTSNGADLGDAVITATVTIGGVEIDGSTTVHVRRGKTQRTVYTEDMIAAARENIELYPWAEEIANAAVKKADKYLPNIDTLYEMVVSEGMPRCCINGINGDSNAQRCRYCGVDLRISHNDYPWIINQINSPWKIKCPECSKSFPSNDFASFYELGKNEHGEFDRDLALERHQEMFGGTYGYGYLKNDLFPDIAESNIDPVTGDVVDGNTWGVDDGWGYNTGRTLPNGDTEVHPYIPLYVHNLWTSQGSIAGRWEAILAEALTSFSEAYVYTGNKEYGIAAAKLLDRLADFYPDYNLNQWCYRPELNEKAPGIYLHASGSATGALTNYVWEASNLARRFPKAYDAIYDIYEEPELIEYLSEKAVKYNYPEKLVNGLTTAGILRDRVENRILRVIYDHVKTGKNSGNFGFKQYTLALTAIALDDEVDTPEMINFTMQGGTTGETSCTGGNVLPTIMNIVDRDGYGNESTMGYNPGWLDNLLGAAEAINTYLELRPGVVSSEYNLLKNPKYQKMLHMFYPLMVGGNQTANIGDYGGTGVLDLSAVMPKITVDTVLAAYRETKEPIFAQLLYYANNNDLSEINYGIFEKNPESLQEEIETYVLRHGTLDVAKSNVLTGYGFAALRYGDLTYKENGERDKNTVQDYWMYWGGAFSHRHNDALNLGIDYKGVDMLPEMGYPETSSSSVTLDKRRKFYAGTVSHNTVLIDENQQDAVFRTQDTMHFDDAGEIKVMDADVPEAYAGLADIYRRTVVSVGIDAENSYAVDFFRVKGGSEHVYSFHAMSNDIAFSDNLTFVDQAEGTYAGSNVAFGDQDYSAAYSSGYNYLDNVSRATNPGTGNFSADFKIENLRKKGVPYGMDLHLGFTMVNDFDLSEVATAVGYPPLGQSGVEEMKWLLVKREGRNLDTLFTTVLEPYENQSSIASIERVSVARADGKQIAEAEPVAAVKVTLVNGRQDYVLYAANNTREYVVTDGDVSFNFAGFAGVYTLDADGELVRTYLNDGSKLYDGTEKSIELADTAISGTVKSFTKELTGDNYIDLVTDSTVAAYKLEGQLIHIDNGFVQNGDYYIESAEKTEDGYRIGTGDVSYIARYADSANLSAGYVYNISAGDRFAISTSEYKEANPYFVTDKSAYVVGVGSLVKIKLVAQRELEGKEFTFNTSDLPRGATFDEDSLTITWVPDENQLGDTVVTLFANDGTLTSEISAVVSVEDRAYGDVNRDSAINALDRTVIARIVAQWVGYTSDVYDFEAADTNGDGKLTSFDRTVIARYVAQWKGYEKLPYIVER